MNIAGTILTVPKRRVLKAAPDEQQQQQGAEQWFQGVRAAGPITQRTTVADTMFRAVGVMVGVGRWLLLVAGRQGWLAGFAPAPAQHFFFGAVVVRMEPAGYPARAFYLTAALLMAASFRWTLWYRDSAAPYQFAVSVCRPSGGGRRFILAGRLNPFE